MLSAAGLYALDHVYPRLGKDHAKARRLAEVINSEGEGMVAVNMDMVETNIVLVKVDRKLSTARRMVELLSSADWPVLALEWDSHTLRLVTHRLGTIIGTD